MKAFLVDLENRPGELARVAEALGARGINIVGVAGATCGDTGRVAIAASDEAGARDALVAAPCRFQEVEIVEASLRHEPGTLGQAARRLAEAGVNIEAVMPTSIHGGDVTVGFLTDDPARAREALAATGAMR